MRFISEAGPGCVHSRTPYAVTINTAAAFAACFAAAAVSFAFGTLQNPASGLDRSRPPSANDTRSPHPSGGAPPPPPGRTVRRGGRLQAATRPQVNDAELLRRYAMPLVQPAMITWQSDSARIAVVIWGGNADGGVAAAAVKEVLKYTDVMQVDVVTGYGRNIGAPPPTSRYWGADERVGMRCDFIENEDEDDKSELDVYSVIFLTDGAGLLSSERKRFFDAVFDASAVDGSIVVGLGDPGAQDFWERHDDVVQFLGNYSFDAIHVYEENDCGIMQRCAFLIMSKQTKFRDAWSMHPMYFDIYLHSYHFERGPQEHFDGATMEKYRTTHRAYQNRFCDAGRNLLLDLCGTVAGIDPRRRDFPPEAFEVRHSTLGEGAGRGLFARVHIPAGSLIMEREAVNSVHFTEATLAVIEKIMWIYLGDFKEVYEVVDMLYSYYDGYGYFGSTISGKEIFVDSGILTFANHGCRGTENLGQLGTKGAFLTPEEYASLRESADKRSEALMVLYRLFRSWRGYNPPVHRHNYLISGGLNFAQRDIAAGEEIFGNYLLYIDSTIEEEDLDKEVSLINSECLGKTVGIVKQVDSTMQTI